MKKCSICGIVKKTTIECPLCKRTVCLNDFWIKMGLCADCITEEYNHYYEKNIEDYSVEENIP